MPTKMKIKEHGPEIWRVSNDSDAFGQIFRRGPRKWEAEIRRTETGEMIRPAGIWATKREAIQECVDLIPQNQIYK